MDKECNRYQVNLVLLVVIMAFLFILPLEDVVLMSYCCSVVCGLSADYAS